MEDIQFFRGEYNYLSNFAYVKINYLGRVYNSVEHAYISAKNDSEEWKVLCSSDILAGTLKIRSKNIELVDNWNDIKYEIMAKLVFKKFIKEPFKSKLLATGNVHIQEGNYWNDSYWGVNMKTGIGENNLGKLIMKMRSHLRKKHL